jgi:hypothetical protein
MEYAGAYYIELSFTNAWQVNIRVNGAIMEIAEMFIAPVDSVPPAIHVWDELIGFSWRSESVVLIGISPLSA